MLTAFDMQVLAYMDEDGLLRCHDCAVSAASTVTVEKVDVGLSDAFDPWSRFELIEHALEAGHDRANDDYPGGVDGRVLRFVAEHPMFGEFMAVRLTRMAVEQRVAYRHGVEWCDCGRRLTPRWSEWPS